VSILESNIKKIPIVYNKEKVISDSYLISYYDSFVVDRSHDCNQNVEETDKHDEHGNVEEDNQVDLEPLVFTVLERFDIDLTETEFCDIQDGFQDVFVW
jgi:hypothetical protein